MCISVRCGRGGWKGGGTGKPGQWSCPLLGDFPQPPPASRTSGRPGWLFPRGQRERGRVAPGGAGRRSSASHTVCFVCFSLPRSRFPLCGGRRDHKGLTHIFNPPPKSKWPVWCLRSARRPLAPVRPVSDSPVPQHCYFPIFASVLLMCGEVLSRRSPCPTPSPRGDPEFEPPTPPRPTVGNNLGLPNRI